MTVKKYQLGNIFCKGDIASGNFIGLCEVYVDKYIEVYWMVILNMYEYHMAVKKISTRK